MQPSDSIGYTFLTESKLLAFSGNDGCCSIRYMQKSWLLIVLWIQSELHSIVLVLTFPKSLPQAHYPNIFQLWTYFVSFQHQSASDETQHLYIGILYHCEKEDGLRDIVLLHGQNFEIQGHCYCCRLFHMRQRGGQTGQVLR